MMKLAALLSKIAQDNLMETELKYFKWKIFSRLGLA